MSTFNLAKFHHAHQEVCKLAVLLDAAFDVNGRGANICVRALDLNEIFVGGQVTAKGYRVSNL
jgi:hypothetical protein